MNDDMVTCPACVESDDLACSLCGGTGEVSRDDWWVFTLGLTEAQPVTVTAEDTPFIN